jgi:hypothetical protein
METKKEFGPSSEVLKIANSSKNGAKIMVLKASFTGEDRTGKRLMPSALHRLMVEAHAKVGDRTVAFNGNIPIESLPSILKLSEEALQDKVIYQQEREFPILTGVWKPKASVKDEEGNTFCYKIDINYNGKNNLPIVITISNSWAPLEIRGDGRNNCMMSKAKNTVYTQFYVTTEDWYNKISAVDLLYKGFKTSMITRGSYDPEFGFATE